jgi:hypothetical protein
MGDFTEILRIIGKIVLFILERTIDIICLALLLISWVLPWRVCEYQGTLFGSDWRADALESFFLTLFDCVTLPLGLISLISPMRWIHIGLAISDYRKSKRWYVKSNIILFSIGN